MAEPRDIGALSPEQRALLMLRLRRKAAPREEETGAIRPVARDRDLPLSFAQQRLWFLARWAPESPAYNVPAAVLLKGALERAALARAIEAIVHRHESLRTMFPASGGEPRQVIAPPGEVPLPGIDLAGLGTYLQSLRPRRACYHGHHVLPPPN